MSDEDDILVLPGFEDAFLGLITHGTKEVACYDEDLCIEIITRDGTSYEDARDHFLFNVKGGWYGDKTPAFLSRSTLEEITECP